MEGRNGSRNIIGKHPADRNPEEKFVFGKDRRGKPRSGNLFGSMGAGEFTERKKEYMP